MSRFGSLMLCLVLALAACGGDGDTAETAEPIVGITWQWQQFLGGDDSVVTAEDPSRYTLTLNDDGTASIVADCNQVVGSYSVDETMLTIELGASTLVRCEEGSLSDRYTTLLSAATSYVMDGDDLVISLFADAGTMHFAPE